MSTNVHRKLMQARMQLQARQIKKSGRNTFANYSYMELADFLVPTQTIFSELALCGVVSFTADVASLTITDIDDGSQIIITSPMGSAALKGCHEVQNVGAVETYQRRYLWVTAMEIVEHDALDSGPEAEPRTERPRQIEDPISGFSPAKSKTIRMAAQTAIQKFNQGDELAAYEEVYGVVNKYGVTQEGVVSQDVRNNLLLAFSTIFHDQSALRASLKKHAEEERKAKVPA